MDAQFTQDLPVQLQDGAGGSGNREGDILGGVELSYGISEGGGLAAADISGDKSHGADPQGIIKTLLDPEQFLGLKDVLEVQVRREGFPGQGIKGAVAHRGSSSFPDQSFPPWYLKPWSEASTSVPLFLFLRTLQLI